MGYGVGVFLFFWHEDIKMVGSCLDAKTCFLSAFIYLYSFNMQICKYLVIHQILFSFNVTVRLLQTLNILQVIRATSGKYDKLR